MDTITMFKQAALQLQSDPRYVALEQAREYNDQDEELQGQIGDFNLARMDLNSEIGKSERNEEKIAELNAKVNALYTEIMASENMQNYNEAKADVDAMLNFINEIISTAVNGGDPMQTQEAPAGGCSGSCSSCSGCH